MNQLSKGETRNKPKQKILESRKTEFTKSKSQQQKSRTKQMSWVNQKSIETKSKGSSGGQPGGRRHNSPSQGKLRGLTTWKAVAVWIK